MFELPMIEEGDVSLDPAGPGDWWEPQRRPLGAGERAASGEIYQPKRVFDAAMVEKAGVSPDPPGQQKPKERQDAQYMLEPSMIKQPRVARRVEDTSYREA